ncbi:MAG: MMPL family transporter, partial [Clostridia bacterium]|nr:MMPL family transporter [Clostridia bacterium]
MIRCLKWLIRHRTITVVVCLLLIIPACIGLTGNRAHYDLISAMPETYDSVIGNRVLQEEFGKGAFSMILTEGLSQAGEYQLEQRLRSIEHVQSVLGYASATGGMLPSEFLPESVRASIELGDRRLIAVFFDESASTEGVMHAVEEIRKAADGQCRIAGAAAWITDLRALAEGRVLQILLVAAALCLLALTMTTDSFLLPFLFIFCSSAGIVWNLGISSLLIKGSGYVKVLAGVFQAGLSSGFSVFLWKAYKEKRDHNPNLNEAMAQAVGKIARSAIGAGLVMASAACMLLQIPFVPVQ